ncbi:hypothetical protein, partial [uncultured Pelagimonas sp.]|uniref:hypothetical protein n=1 Tax=uncultured Pelagimonas sp. TaxID=1618102 RepID=UPI002623D5F8
YLFLHLSFSITQYPYFWVSGKQGAVQSIGKTETTKVQSSIEMRATLFSSAHFKRYGLEVIGRPSITK